MEKEIQIHGALKHDHIIELLNAATVEPDSAAASTYVPGVYILLEIAAGGDLFDKIGGSLLWHFSAREERSYTQAPDVGISDDLAHLYFSQMVAGIVRSFALSMPPSLTPIQSFIHSQGICHRYLHSLTFNSILFSNRDLKPENILLSGSGQVKISDFGLASVFALRGQTRLLSERCGSLPYVAPEVRIYPHNLHLGCF